MDMFIFHLKCWKTNVQNFLQVERSKIAPPRIDELDILSKVKIQTDDEGRTSRLSFLYVSL